MAAASPLNQGNTQSVLHLKHSDVPYFASQVLKVDGVGAVFSGKGREGGGAWKSWGDSGRLITKLCFLPLFTEKQDAHDDGKQSTQLSCRQQ